MSVEKGTHETVIGWEINGLGNVKSHLDHNYFSVSNLNDTGLFLSVEVYPTAFPFKTVHYVSIYVNDVMLSEFCTPGRECGEEFYTCLHDIDVKNYTSSLRGGSLVVNVVSTGLQSSICDYRGYPLYVRFTLSESPTIMTESPSLPMEQTSSDTLGLLVSYEVKTGFVMILVGWATVGAFFGVWIRKIRINDVDKKLISFRWYATN